MLQKIREIQASELLDLVKAGEIKDVNRIIWKGKTANYNIVFVATNDNLIDMILDTTLPTDIFEIWAQEETIERA